MTQQRSNTTTTRRAFVAGTIATAAGLAVPASADAAVTPRAAQPSTIKLVSYNVGDKATATLRDQLTRLMTDVKPHVMALQEVADRRDLLEGNGEAIGVAARNGYRIRYFDEIGPADTHCVMLVRQGVEVIEWNIGNLSPAANDIDPRTPGANGQAYFPPRYINFVRVLVDGRAWAIGTVHLVPSVERFPRNERLHRQQVARCAEWITDRISNEPILMGDYNAERTGRFMTALDGVAKGRGMPSFGTRTIDHFWTPEDAVGPVEALEGFGGDHRPIVGSFTVTR